MAALPGLATVPVQWHSECLVFSGSVLLFFGLGSIYFIHNTFQQIGGLFSCFYPLSSGSTAPWLCGLGGLLGLSGRVSLTCGRGDIGRSWGVAVVIFVKILEQCLAQSWWVADAGCYG